MSSDTDILSGHALLAAAEAQTGLRDYGDESLPVRFSEAVSQIRKAGMNEAGREEKVELNLPKGMKLTRIDNNSLSNMVASGELDCALVARPPDCFQKSHPDVARLFPNYLEMEEQYYARTKIWPIMHVIAIKCAILDQHPWIAGSLYNAFNESKNRALSRMFEQSVSRYPLPWLTTYARRMRDIQGAFDPVGETHACLR
jgi:4,5-dihydroxyphthalate decarboxylase